MLWLPALWLGLATLLCLPHRPAGRPSTQRLSKGVDWLTRYGYLPPPDPMQARLQTEEGLQDAVRMMQKFAGLQATGILDDRTLAMMDQPRCSLPDIIGTSELMRRRKRYAHSGSVWPVKELTWTVRSYPQASGLPRDQVRTLLFYALQAWGNASALTFHEAPDADADILVDFSRSFHEDGYPFDGPGSTLAHAFFPGEHPISGDTHFDDEETWVYDPQATQQGAGTDLFAVAVHEFGHALGLAHSSTKESIMMPYYQGPVGLAHLYQLPPDDALGIQTLYGRRELRPGEEPPARPIPTQPRIPDLPPHRPTWQPRPPAPDRCQAHFDAIANIRGEVFFFKRKHFWRMQPARNLVSLEPAQTQRFWMGLPLDFGTIDAVYERSNDSKIVFFIGQHFWVFTDTRVDPGSPHPITDLGLPPGVTVEAAFVWGHNGKTYFFENSHYWRFDDRAGNVEPGYPRSLTLWKGVPPGLDDIISWNDGSTYFFKGTQYWRFLGGSVEAESGYPRSAPQDWMYCQGSPTTSPAPGPRGGSGKPGGGQCLCSGALPGPLPAFLTWTLALAWALQ
ncbi:matrix metalloproteinase-25 isoform X2 [Caretta caretta]|uniref:matrix metalloproteinase-25 isoform X2 n=1 Tax=Caretta caretta TaxID=8467 RepID=UPI0020964C5E|nr:matrix metalloproteinase-25 isoform X2 [Caretta caretta]